MGDHPILYMPQLAVGDVILWTPNGDFMAAEISIIDEIINRGDVPVQQQQVNPDVKYYKTILPPPHAAPNEFLINSTNIIAEIGNITNVIPKISALKAAHNLRHPAPVENAEDPPMHVGGKRYKQRKIKKTKRSTRRYKKTY